MTEIQCVLFNTSTSPTLIKASHAWEHKDDYSTSDIRHLEMYVVPLGSANNTSCTCNHSNKQYCHYSMSTNPLTTSIHPLPSPFSQQGVVLVVLAAALCDLSYTVYKDTAGRVANFHYVTPIVLVLTMVGHILTLMHNDLTSSYLYCWMTCQVPFLHVNIYVYANACGYWYFYINWWFSQFLLVILWSLRQWSLLLLSHMPNIDCSYVACT